MQLFDRLVRFLAKVAFLSAAEWYLVTKIFADKIPRIIVNHALGLSVFISFILLAVYGSVIYPLYVSPLRHLPTVEVRP